MTREYEFTTSFITQLEAFALWNLTQPVSKKKLPLSAFTAFSVELGTTTYSNFDLTGKAANGAQDFTLTVYFTKPENMFDGARQARSDAVASVESFINVPIFTPPAMFPGYSYRIDRAQIVSTSGWRYDPSETRFEFTVKGKYFFTLF
jgi:hypothetical protein